MTIERGPYSERTLGDYALGACLARHPHGEVYRARDARLDREVVIKLVPGGAATAAMQARCLAEARVAARIDHPCATRVYGHGVEADGTCWIALEAVRGPTLTELVAARGPLGVVDTVELITRLAEVLATMHEQGLWHRDLKPDNVLVVARAGRRLPILCDFGLTALAIDGPAGTPAYMAPEQWSGGAIDGRTDGYGLALCAWFALTGRDAFVGAARGPLPALVSPAIGAWLASAVAIDPAARPSGVLALAAGLRAACGERVRPRLDEHLVDAMLATAPEPIAEAVAAWEAALTPRAELDAAVAVTAIVARWLAVCAIAIRRDRGGSAVPVGSAGLEAEAWLAIARDDDPRTELAVAIDRAARAVTFAAIDAAAPLDERIAAELHRAAAMLRAAAPVLALRVVVRTDARVERWTGVRRRRRPAVWIDDAAALPARVPVVIDETGRPQAILDGLAAVASPVAAEPEELFVLAARDGAYAVLTAGAAGYQHRVAAEALGALPDASAGAADLDDDGPYRGLAAFGADDAAWFVGREREVEACVNRLRDRGLVAVVGASGAGKSSFVLAGVVPAFAARHVVVCRPGARPLAALASAFGVVGDALDDVVDAARARDGGVLVVIDQLEEVVTRADADGAAALGAVVRALTARDELRVVVTVRDDFLVRAASALGLAAELSAGVQLIDAPAAAELRRIVVEPAARAGYHFDDAALPDAMVAAAVGATSPLPLLSFAARALWTRRDRRLRLLCRRDLDAIGGLVGALASHADATVDALAPAAAAAVRPLLAALATAEGTRIALPRAELAALVDGADAVIAALVDARLLVDRDGAIELVHEALLTAWPRLARWRHDDAAAARLRDELRVAAQQWSARGRPRSLLWRGEALDELRRWRRREALHLPRGDEAFCVASERDAERRARRRRIAIGAGVAVTVAVVAVLAGATRAARHSRRVATAAEARAHAALIDALVEQGRVAAVDGQPLAALAWLDAALGEGAARAPLERLIGETAAAIEHAQWTAVALRAPVHTAAWSPSGALLAIGGAAADARVVVIDRAGAIVRAWPARADTITAVAIAPDDRAIAIVSRGGGYAIADVGTGVERVAVAGDAVLARWSPRGRWLAITTRAHGVVLLDGATLAPARTLGPLGVSVEAAWLDDERVVIGDRNGGLALYTAADGRGIAQHASEVRVLDLVAAGGRVAIHPYDGARAAVWNPDTDDWQELAGHGAAIESVAISRDGAQVSTADADGTVAVWRGDGAVARTLVGHGGGAEVAWAAATPVSAGADGTVRAWHVDAAVVRAGHAAAITALAIDPRGELIATGDALGRLALWSSAALAPPAHREVDGARTLLIAGARTVAIGPGLALALDGAALPSVRPFPSGADGPVTSAYVRRGGVAADGRLAIPDGDAVAVIAGDAVARCALGASVQVAAIAPDGAQVIGATRTGAARCTPDGVAVPIAGVTGAIWAAAFSPDGGVLALGGQAGEVRLVTLATGAVAVAALGAGVTELVWLDDQRVAATTRAGDVQLVARDGARGATIAGVGVAANALAIVDRDHLAVAFDDGAVALVSLPLGRSVARWQVAGTATGVAVIGDALAVVAGGRVTTLPLTPRGPSGLSALVGCRAALRVDGSRLVRAPLPTPPCP